MKKFELTGETMTTLFGKTLHRIRAVSDIVDSVGNVIVKAGQLGGWLEKERNLSQYGNAWVFDDAMVFGNAWVYGESQVFGNAVVKKSPKRTATIITPCDTLKHAITPNLDIKNVIFNDPATIIIWGMTQKLLLSAPMKTMTQKRDWLWLLPRKSSATMETTTMSLRSGFLRKLKKSSPSLRGEATLLAGMTNSRT